MKPLGLPENIARCIPVGETLPEFCGGCKFDKMPLDEAIDYVFCFGEEATRHTCSKAAKP
jgi:hypothetical protein